MLQRLRSFFALCLLIFPLLATLPPPVVGADSTSFDPTKIAVTAKSIGGVPVGTIISWPVAQNPHDFQNSDGTYNWLECNGQSFNTTVYPELFALVGPTVPDLRGLFLRGLGGNSAALGVKQDDMVGPHDHIVSIRDGDGGGSGTPAFDETNSPWGWINFRTTAGNNMGAETRPKNQAVRYLMRARR